MIWMRPATRSLLQRGYACLLWGCALFGPLASAQAANIAVVLSEESAAYRDVANAMRDSLEREAPNRFKVWTLPAARLEKDQADILRSDYYQLVVSVGNRAADLVESLDVKVPILHTLVPRVTVERLLAMHKPANGPRPSALYLDQPLNRQLQLIRLTLPTVARIGIVYSPDSLSMAPAFERAARAMGFAVESETISRRAELAKALTRVLERSDVLFTLPDPEIFSKSTVHSVLLSAYRANDPVFAFSSAYVTAGAFAAVFSTSSQIGQHAGEIIAKLGDKDSALPEPQYPKYFTIEVNKNVARSMGIAVQDDVVLQEKLRQTPVVGEL